MRVQTCSFTIAAFAWILLAGASRAQNGPAETSAPKSVEIDEEGHVLTRGSDVVAGATPVTMDLLRSVEKQHSGSKTISGTFEQVKESQIFLETIRSNGKLAYLKPDYFRVDYTTLDDTGKPGEKTTNLIVKDAIYVHTPSIQQVERYRFHSPEERDQQLHVMIMGLGFKAEDIAREYRVRSSEDDPELQTELKGAGDDPAKLALVSAVPAAEYAETSPFTQMKLSIDKTTMRPQKIWFEDYNGDQTTITNLDVKFDAPIDPAIFEAKFPAGTEMIDKTDK